MKKRFPRSLAFGLYLFAMLLVLSAQASKAQYVDPSDPQPENLSPGLAVDYYFHFFRSIDELVDWESYKEGKPGDPIQKLDYRVGQDNVLTSESSDGVGAKMTGYILLDTPGAYSFAFESNDGVRLEIADYMVIEDPDVHADRFSDIGAVIVKEPGWYPLTIRYFERKNTSTLRFYWLPPGGTGTMPIVPADALAHKPR